MHVVLRQFHMFVKMHDLLYSSMHYVNHLPTFDPAKHLVASDLRAIEEKNGYQDLPQVFERKMGTNTIGMSAAKIRKSQHETQLLVAACAKMERAKIEHPPYGLIRPFAGMSRLIAPELTPVTASPMEEEELRLLMQAGGLNGLHALSDLKLQHILHALLCDPEVQASLAAAQAEASQVVRVTTNNRTSDWKHTIQSSASNAKRSDFILLRQILIQFVRTLKRAPTREEFLDCAAGSQDTLEVLATTHQAVFKSLNERIIKDASVGTHHELVQHNGKGKVVLRKNIVDRLDVERGQPKIRTMCAALLAKDEGGASVLERNFAEDTALVADAVFLQADGVMASIQRIAAETLPKVSIHMFLRFATVEISRRDQEG